MSDQNSYSRLLILLAGIVPSALFAQDYVQGEPMRQVYGLDGLGVVGREVAGEVPCVGENSGSYRIQLSDSPDGPGVAELELRRSTFGSCEISLIRAGDSESLNRGWDLPETSYEALALTYYERRQGFVRVLQHTMPPGLWMRIEDVPEGRLRPWTELLVQTKRLYLGYEGHELRYEPSEFSAVMVTLRDRRIHETAVHELLPTGSVSGVWGEFDVIEYDGEFYSLAQSTQAYPTGNRWKGWLRLVNEAGAPEIWFHTRD